MEKVIEKDLGRDEITWKYPILLYDGECALCCRFKDAINRIDESNVIEKVNLHTNEVYMKFPFLKKHTCREVLHLLTGPDTVLLGGEAIAYMIKIYPKVKSFAWLIDNNAGQKGLDYFYKIANKYRRSFSKNCFNCKS